MFSAKVICDGNFTKSSQIDKSVENVLKMFKKHFSKKSKPLNDDSDIELVYEYKNLTCDELRILKRLVKSNRSIIHFKRIEDNGEECDEKVKKGKKSKSKSKSKNFEHEEGCSISSSVSSETNISCLGIETKSDSGSSCCLSEHSDNTSKSCESTKSKSTCSSKSSKKSCVSDDDICETRDDVMKEISELSERLQTLLKKLENMP